MDNKFKKQKDAADKAAESEAKVSATENGKGVGTKGYDAEKGATPEGATTYKPTTSGSEKTDTEDKGAENVETSESNESGATDEERAEFKRLEDKRHNMPITGEEAARFDVLKGKIEG